MLKQDSAPPWTAPGVSNTTLLVLCGGQGTRMGGADKPLLPWRDRAMLDHVLASVPEGMPKLISANRNVDTYALRAPVLQDSTVLQQYSLQPGPLVGVLAGLQQISLDDTQQWLLVCPGDTPCLTADWWQVMQQSAAEHRAYAVVAHDGERQQHLHLLLHQHLSADLLAYLQRGRIAVFKWLANLQAVQAAFAEPAGFTNINRPEDLEDI